MPIKPPSDENKFIIPAEFTEELQICPDPRLFLDWKYKAAQKSMDDGIIKACLSQEYSTSTASNNENSSTLTSETLKEAIDMLQEKQEEELKKTVFTGTPRMQREPDYEIFGFPVYINEHLPPTPIYEDVPVYAHWIWRTKIWKAIVEFFGVEFNDVVCYVNKKVGERDDIWFIGDGYHMKLNLYNQIKKEAEKNAGPATRTPKIFGFSSKDYGKI